ncbi:MAG: DDE-type integrase/transposase/recombinase [Rhodobacteraceae bacterium]|nr:DDE-type integrase/transposase/recombinase [Paracoccaceae bacterium]
MTLPLVSSEEFASAASIGLRAAQLALRNAAQGKLWRGEPLPVVPLEGQRGGAAGCAYALDLSQCSPAFLAKYPFLRALRDEAVAPAPRVPVGVLEPWRVKEQHRRRDILRPAMGTAPKSRERGKVLRDIAAAHGVAFKTLQRWLLDYDNKGLAGLLPKPNGNPGKRRVLVTRAWDRGIDLDDDQKRDVADLIAKRGRSMAANDGTPDRKIIELCENVLRDECLARGSKMHPRVLASVCKLNTKWCAGIDTDQARLDYLRKNDHKVWQDKCVNRVRRALHHQPMGLLIGDVHYVDMLVTEAMHSGRSDLIHAGAAAQSAGRETIRVRLIAWMDAASLFAWVTPVFLAKGQGITQADVAQSLAQVAFCPHGGIPNEFYLDNGGEYKALPDSMTQLANLADMEFGMTLAKPYSPTSKGDIEGFFNILEGILKGLPGWIGGDRTNKKSENKGKVVQPYTKGIAALEADIASAVMIYNDRRQSGRLKGLSPLDMLNRKIKETGFEARVPSEEAFDLIFSRSERRTIRQNAIHYDKRQWHTPALDDLPMGEEVEIRVPLRKGADRIFVRRGKTDLGWAEPMRVFEHGDRDGARYQAQLEKGRNAAVDRIAATIDPNVSTFEYQKAAVRRTAPDANPPQSWTTGIDKTRDRATVAEIEADEDAARRAEINEILRGYGAEVERRADG